MYGGPQDNETPLWYAARNGHPEIVRLLVERGAYKEAKSDVCTRCIGPAATRCVWAQRVVCCSAVLSRLRRRAQGGITPLYEAARNGHLEVARLLLDHGADKDAKTDVRTPMQMPRPTALLAGAAVGSLGGAVLNCAAEAGAMARRMAGRRY